MLSVVFAVVSTFAFNYQVSLPKLADERWGGEGRFGLVLSVTERRRAHRVAADGPAGRA